MSRSKKWRLEWAFFLGENGRRQYNHIIIKYKDMVVCVRIREKCLL